MIPGVPADGNYSPDDQIKLAATAVYMVLGMAFLSMAFQLLQDQMDVNFKKFSTLKKKEEVEDEDEDSVEASGL